MKLRPIVSSLIAASLLLASTHPVDAQKKRPSGVGSLAEMSCQSIKGKYAATNGDVSVGLEIFRAIAEFDDGRWHSIFGNDPYQVVCRLAAAKEKPKYKTLTLAFGMDDKEANNDQQIRLSLYKDGKAYDYKDITKGEKLLWQIDVTGTRSLALEVECIKGKNKACPRLYFFEDTLK
jgi:hypothetical protein